MPTTTAAARLLPRSLNSGAEDSEQRMNFSIGDGSMLEYWPDPLIPFAVSRHVQRTSFSLARHATLIWWEVLAHTFAFDRLQISSAIDICGKPALREDFVLEPSKRPLTSLARMGNATHLRSFNVFSEGKTSAFGQLSSINYEKRSPKAGASPSPLEA